MPIQPHRKLVKHYHQPGDFHELTFSCYRRLPLLTNDTWRERLARSIDEANQIHSMRLVAFVFMPEHVHLLVFPDERRPNIGRYLAQIKQPFSKSIKQVLVDCNSPLLQQLTISERPGKTCFRFWQEGPGYDRNLDVASSVEASVNYLHTNPVSRGLCQQAIDWKWSSARWYLAHPPRQQSPDLPLIHGLPDGSLE